MEYPVEKMCTNDMRINKDLFIIFYYIYSLFKMTNDISLKNSNKNLTVILVLQNCSKEYEKIKDYKLHLRTYGHKKVL